MEESLNFDQVKAMSTNQTQQSNFLEVDHKFLAKICEISEKQASMNKACCEEADISDEKCDQIAQFAQTHAQASIFNSASVMEFSLMKNDETKDFCACGCKKGVGEPIPLCTNEQEYTFLGPGILLFFFYLKHIRIIIIFIMFSYGGFAFITNFLSQDVNIDEVCLSKYEFEKQLCQLHSISTLQLKQASIYRYVQLWMILFVALVWFFGVKFIKFLGQRKNQEITECLQSTSDYTMRISNLPFGTYNQKQLIEFIEGLWQKKRQDAQNNYTETNPNSEQKLGLQSIQIIYDMKQCRDLIVKIKKLSLELTSLLNERNRILKQNFTLYKTKKAKLKSILKEIEDFRNQFMFNEEFRKIKSTTCALIEFKSAEQQQKFLAHFQSKKQSGLLCQQRKKYTFKNSDVIFERAPQPSDFIWSNCETKFDYLRCFGMRAALAIVLFTAYGLRISLDTFEIMKGHQCLTTALALQFFNKLIWNTQSFLVKYEYQNTKTEQMVSLMKTSIFAQFINIIVTPIIGRHIKGRQLYGQISFSFMTLNYQTLALLMMPIFNVVSPTFFFKVIVKSFTCLRRKMIRMLCISVKQIDAVEQIRPVLSYYEGPAFPLAGAFVFTVSLLFHALFYCHIQPIILVFPIVNLTLYYIVLKYLLFRRCKIPELTR